MRTHAPRRSRRWLARSLAVALAALSLISVASTQATATPTADQVAAGLQHSCLLSSGNVWCWGDNTHGELGQGSFGGSSAIAVEVVDPSDPSGHLSGVSEISAGTYQTCAVGATGTVSCWGTLGQGLNSPASWQSAPTPFPLPAPGPYVAVSAGQFDTCALAGNLTDLVCGGDPGRSIVGVHTFPHPVATDPSGHYMIGLGSYEACAGLTDGSVWCFGDTGFGAAAVPVQAAGPWGSGVSAVSVAAGYFMDVCAAFSDGSSWCWNHNGTSNTFTQVLVAGSAATGVADQNGHVCALTGGGGTCWTDSFGSFGNGAAIVTGLTGAGQIAAAGLGGGCAVVSGGVECWGDNSSGQLGDGTTTSSASPVLVVGFVPTTTTTSTTAPPTTTTTTAPPTTTTTAPPTTTTTTAPSVQAMLSSLNSAVGAIGGGSFSAQVDAAQAAVAKGQKSSACGSLNAFTNHVKAQSGKQLSAGQANQLLVSANRISSALGC